MDDPNYLALTNVHNRLNDSHILWHQALQSYFDPDSFRVSAQSCIQALRSVTWLLQNHKAKIPNFDAWYKNWQTTMQGDPVMVWLKNARNRIEKQGDLESHSTSTAQIIASYLDEPVIEIEGCLFDSVQQLLSKVSKTALEKQVLEHGALKLQRRWVSNDLPKHEILDALSYVFAKLLLMTNEAHQQLKSNTNFQPKRTHFCREFDSKSATGKLACMIRGEDSRSLIISLKTGETVEFEDKTVVPTQQEMENIATRYNSTTRLPFPKKTDSTKDIARYYHSVARQIFLLDGYHSSIAMLLRKGHLVAALELKLDNRNHKYLAMRRVATYVDQHQADLVILTGESWYAKVKADQPYLYPSDMQEKGEQLTVWCCSAKGEQLAISSEIHRNGKQVQLGNVSEQDNLPLTIFEPIFQIWQRQNGC